MSSVAIKDIMNPHPATAVSGQPLVDVVALLINQKTTGLPVVDDQRRVVGFVSEQDCIHSLIDSSYFCEGNPVVDEVMRRDVLTVKPSDGVLDLARAMELHKPKVYPVVDNGKLVGLVTRKDVLAALREETLNCSVHKR